MPIDTNDPWLIKKDDIDKIVADAKGKSSGTFCPRFNGTGNKQCQVCAAIYPLGGYPLGSPEYETYRNKKAKKSWYLNVVLKDNPTKNIILEVGVKLANQILAGASDPNKGWHSITHPKANKGLITKITKQRVPGSEYPSYDVFVDMDRPDWDISEDILNNLHNLDREHLIEMIKGGQLTSDNYLNITSLEPGQTLAFRILPSWNWKNGDTRFANFVARHWGGVTDAEVSGEVQVNIDVKEVFDADEPVKEKEGQKKCFGEVDCYDEKSPECLKCSLNKECHKEVLKKSIS